MIVRSGRGPAHRQAWCHAALVLLPFVVGALLAGCTGMAPPDSAATTPQSLASECFAGGMAACDSLAAYEGLSAAGQTYGRSCAGRGKETSSCVSRYGSGVEGGKVPAVDFTLEGEFEACEAGKLQRCDAARKGTPEGTALYSYAASCGGRFEESESPCADRVPPRTPPLGLGSDPRLEEEAGACADADLTACDDLAGPARVAPPPTTDSSASTGPSTDPSPSPSASPQSDSVQPSTPPGHSADEQQTSTESAAVTSAQAYGSTCGGRTPQPVTSCREEWPAGPLSALPKATGKKTLLRLGRRCLGTDWAACDRLVAATADGRYPALIRYAETCGARQTGPPCATSSLAAIPPAVDYAGVDLSLTRATSASATTKSAPSPSAPSPRPTTTTTPPVVVTTVVIIRPEPVRASGSVASAPPSGKRLTPVTTDVAECNGIASAVLTALQKAPARLLELGVSKKDVFTGQPVTVTLNLRADLPVALDRDIEAAMRGSKGAFLTVSPALVGAPGPGSAVSSVLVRRGSAGVVIAKGTLASFTSTPGEAGALQVTLTVTSVNSVQTGARMTIKSDRPVTGPPADPWPFLREIIIGLVVLAIGAAAPYCWRRLKGSEKP